MNRTSLNLQPITYSMSYLQYMVAIPRQMRTLLLQMNCHKNPSITNLKNMGFTVDEADNDLTTTTVYINYI